MANKKADQACPKCHGSGRHSSCLKSYHNGTHWSDCSYTDLNWGEYGRDVKCECSRVDCSCTKSGSCFITTATVTALGKPDDCYELTQFRSFRDNWVKESFPNLAQEYYEKAPAIVAKIEAKENSEVIWKNVWKEYLQPCLVVIENKDYDSAMEIYTNAIKHLQSMD